MELVIEYITPFSKREDEKVYTRILEREDGFLFQYEKKSIPFLSNFSQIGNEELILAKNYKNLEQFWREFVQDENWIIHRPIIINSDNLIDFVGKELKEMKKENRLPIDKILIVSSWEKFVMLKELPNQYCARCNKQVMYFPRYPKYICNECASLDKIDENGLIVSFTNVDLSGGLRISYWKNGRRIREDSSKLSKICYIDGEKYIATEARFGGVVIQKIDVEKIL